MDVVRASRVVLTDDRVAPTAIYLFLVDAGIRVVEAVARVMSAPTMRILTFMLALFVNRRDACAIIAGNALMVRFRIRDLNRVIVVVLAWASIIAIRVNNLLCMLADDDIVVMDIPCVPRLLLFAYIVIRYDVA